MFPLPNSAAPSLGSPRLLITSIAIKISVVCRFFLKNTTSSLYFRIRCIRHPPFSCFPNPVPIRCRFPSTCMFLGIGAHLSTSLLSPHSLRLCDDLHWPSILPLLDELEKIKAIQGNYLKVDWIQPREVNTHYLQNVQ